MFYCWMDQTPVGRLFLACDEQGLRFVLFDDNDTALRQFGLESWEHRPEALADVTDQLRAYFSGQLQTFDVTLAGQGTEFQKSVWNALCDVPYGHTASYGDIARSIGRPTASRAVGMANGRNPISIIVPCHRIIGTSGKLVGYGGGLQRKQTLLKIEGHSVEAVPGSSLQNLQHAGA